MKIGARIRLISTIIGKISVRLACRLLGAHTSGSWSEALFLCILLPLALSACSPLVARLSNHTDDSQSSGKYGYIDTSGLYKIKPQYFNAQNFSEGLAAVVKGTQLSYIRTDATQAFPRSLEIPLSQGNALFHSGICATCRVTYHDFVSQNCSFSEDLAAAPFGADRNFLWGYINKDGNTVIKPQFKAANAFHDGTSFAQIEPAPV